MEEEFEKPAKGRRMKGARSGDNLTRGRIKKVNEFMTDLKGVMVSDNIITPIQTFPKKLGHHAHAFLFLKEDIFEQERDDTLPPSEKAICQKLLLTISVKSKLFSQSQRDTAKKLLDRLEGDRRRKCRTSNIGIDTNVVDETLFAPSIRKELLIVSSKKKRKKGCKKESKAANDEDSESDSDDENKQTKKKTIRESELDDDGFLKHSDDEGDWSDVDDGTVRPHTQRLSSFTSFSYTHCTLLQTCTKVGRN